MLRLLLAIHFATLFFHPSPLVADTALTGRGRVYNSYFLEDHRLRHQRYELGIKQASSVTDSISTVVEGRFRGDAALYPDSRASRHDYSKAVRDDEMVEAEARQLYIDYLQNFGLKFGLQQIDWVDSLSPNTSDILTPLDFRHGGFGDANEIIEPVLSLNLNHPAPGGALDWLLVPLPKTHRLPKGENGYGYYAFLRHLADNPAATIEEKNIPRQINEIEGGLRYLLSFDGLEFTFLGYRGHHRMPVLTLEYPLPNEVVITQSYPRVNTFGFSSTYSADAWVARFLSFHEPRREPAVTVVLPAASTETEDMHETRTRIGIGFDYIFSKHLKIYTEQFENITQSITNGETEEKINYEYVGSFRATNETWTNILFSLEGTLVSPKAGHTLSPKLAYNNGKVELAAGGRIIRSFSEESRLEPIKDTSQVYLSLTGFFDVRKAP